MKKFALILIIAVMSTFASAVVASDLGNKWWPYNPFRHFSGTYEMISSGSCIHSEEGYIEEVPPFTPKNLNKIYAGTTVAEGTWIFNKGGKGTYTITNYATILPGGPGYPAGLPFVKQSTLTNIPFVFVVTPFGDITVTVGKDISAGGSGKVQLIGSISIDRKTMTLLSANQIQKFDDPLWWTICNTSRTLIKVDD